MNKASILRNILSNPKGISLLETLIAIIILAVALISISYFFSRARINIEASGHMRCGLALAQDKMEQLKDLGYSHPDLSEGIHWDQVDSAGNVPPEVGGQFYWEWTITDRDDPADGNFSSISGGNENWARGPNSSISGGVLVETPPEWYDTWAAGDYRWGW